MLKHYCRKDLEARQKEKELAAHSRNKDFRKNKIEVQRLSQKNPLKVGGCLF